MRRAAALALVAACGPGETTPTALLLRVDFDESLGIDQLEVDLTGSSGRSPEEPRPLESGVTLAVLLADGVAGSEIDLVVYGYAGGERVAVGAASATPVRGETVEVAVALWELLCDAGAYEGPEECNGRDDDCDGATDDGDNACGGACSLDEEPGAPCDFEDPDDLIDNDSCEDDEWRCVDANTVGCVDVDNDVDNDGYSMSDEPCPSADCLDDNEDAAPGAAERCDGVDNDCDGEIDEDVDSSASESCNGADDDCDGEIDEANDEGDDNGCGGVCALDFDPGVRCDSIGDADDCFDGVVVCEGANDSLCDDSGNDADGDGYSDVGDCGCGPVCDYCYCGTATEDACPTAWKGTSDGCDCGCQFVDPDCGGETGDCTTADCNDDDDLINSATPEDCDGVDQDCDGSIDDGLGADANGCGGVCVLTETVGDPCDGADADLCAEGTYSCSGLNAVACSDGTGDNVEDCDGTDDDCDGTIDQGGNACGGVCPLAGTPDDPCDGPDTDLCAEGAYSCSGLNAVTCSDATGDDVEDCDGTDDDCDDTIDEGGNACGGVCALAGTPDDPCDGADADLCAEGTYSCSGLNAVACSDATGADVEDCDGTDDDCDGTIDEGSNACGGVCVLLTAPGAACDSPDDSDLCDDDAYECAGLNAVLCIDAVGDVDSDGFDEGSITCGGDCDDGVGAINPGAAETCNGLDDDCDGEADVGCGCAPDGATMSCGTDVGECDFGSQTCVAGAWDVCAGGAGPGVEDCANGVDDDCDGRTDEGTDLGLACDGSDGDACTEGVFTCTGCSDATGTIVEACGNSADDDCDGTIDEDSADCTLGVTSADCTGGTFDATFGATGSCGGYFALTYDSPTCGTVSLSWTGSCIASYAVSNSCLPTTTVTLDYTPCDATRPTCNLVVDPCP